MEYEDWIESEVDNLLAEDGECYPFTEKNIIEAFNEMKLGPQLNLVINIISAAKLPDNPVSERLVYLSVMAGIKGYWEDMAKNTAEHNWERYTYSLDDKRHA